MTDPRFTHVAIATLATLLWPPGQLRSQAIRVLSDEPIAIGLQNRALVEPALAINPANSQHLVGTAIVSDATINFTQDTSRNRVRCATFASMDGGISWTRHDVPALACFDPWVAISPDGHAVWVGFGEDPHLLHQGRGGLIAYHSADGGRTWDAQPTGLGRAVDHPTIVVDGSSPIRRGWMYVLGTHYVAADNGIVRAIMSVTRSRHNGTRFDLPMQVRPPTNLEVNAQKAVILSDGSVVISFVEHSTAGGRRLLRDRAFVARSTDAAYTFSRPMFVTEACGTYDRTFSQSWLVADTSSGPFRDRLYWICNQFATREILLTQSNDKGISWSEAKRVHPTPRDTLTHRKIMAAAVNGSGVLGVVWRESTAGERDTDCENVYFAASVAGSDTLSAPVRVNSETGCVREAENGRAGSDYYGMATDDKGRFRLLYSDGRTRLYSLRIATIEVNGQVGPK